MSEISEEEHIVSSGRPLENCNADGVGEYQKSAFAAPKCLEEVLLEADRKMVGQEVKLARVDVEACKPDPGVWTSLTGRGMLRSGAR